MVWKSTVVLAAGALLVAGCGGGGGQSNARALSTRPDKPGAMTLSLGVKPPGKLSYGPRATAKPGSTLQFQARVFSNGGQQARDVTVRLSAPKSLHLVGASELLKPVTVSVANAQPLAGDLLTGIALGPYPPDAASNVLFEMTVPNNAKARDPQKVKLTLRGIGFTRTSSVTITPS